MTNRLTESLKEALDFAQGRKTGSRTSQHKTVEAIKIPDDISPREVRLSLNMTQEEFAARFGFNLYTLRNWEHNRRHPDQAVMAYLYAISKNPKDIENSLRD